MTLTNNGDLIPEIVRRGFQELLEGLHSGSTELLNQLLSSRSPTAPVHPPIRVTGPPELHHVKGRYPHAPNGTKLKSLTLLYFYGNASQPTGRPSV